MAVFCCNFVGCKDKRNLQTFHTLKKLQLCHWPDVLLYRYDNAVPLQPYMDVSDEH